jgi:hypothetical protein
MAYMERGQREGLVVQRFGCQRRSKQGWVGQRQAAASAAGAIKSNRSCDSRRPHTHLTREGLSVKSRRQQARPVGVCHLGQRAASVCISHRPRKVRGSQ